MRMLVIGMAGACTLGAIAARGGPEIAIHREAFRDRVEACFLGKRIGGTLGQPVEGRRELLALTFFAPVPTETAANNGLDLQMLWLRALQERGPGLTCRDLAEYWLTHVTADRNEYRIARRNLRDGFPPPLSGQFRNAQWRDGNGAWMRSELWACLAPGQPALAARYAWEDACVDHGAGEGTYAAVFTAALQSAAFVEQDRNRLLEIGLAYIPPDGRLAASVRAALDAHRRGLGLREAREEVIKTSASTGWLQAPRNVAFVVLGWLYGDGDFGQSLCAAVNCGDNTAATGAALGAILGILGGTAAIPPAWRQPVGDALPTAAVAGFEPPRTVGALADAVVAATPAVLAHHGIPPRAAEAGAPAVAVRDIPLVQPAVAEALWQRSPYAADFAGDGVRVSLDMGREPLLEAGVPYELRLMLHNTSERPRDLRVKWITPEGVSAAPESAAVALPAGAASTSVTVRVYAEDLPTPILRGMVTVTGARGGSPQMAIPYTFAAHLAVHRDNLALAARGARATSDSEYEREPGGTARAIDGVIPGPADVAGQRWHAALTPHPHWLAVDLGATQAIARVVVHIADPAGRPLDFEGQASLDGTAWTPLFAERGCLETVRYTRELGGAVLRHFRLVIHRSAGAPSPHAAQIGELELIGLPGPAAAAPDAGR